MQNDLFEKAPVHKAYFSFALPVVFSMVISLIYNMADTYFIAGTGNTNLVAGVSLGAPIFTLMIALGDIFGLGGSSVISRLFGQKKDEDGKRLSVFCFYGAIVCGVIVAAVMMIFRAPILQVLGADSDTIVYASQYYTWLVLGAPFIILVYTPSNLLRTEGFAVGSMTGTVLGAVVNIILDPVFIFVLDMGVVGAATATVISQALSAVWVLRFLISAKSQIHLRISDLKPDVKILGSILALGVSPFIMAATESAITIVMNHGLQTYGGDLYVGSMTILQSVLQLIFVPINGFTNGVQPIISYNFGAGQFERVKKAIKNMLIITFLFSFAYVMFAMICPGVFAGMFTNDADLIDLVKRVLPIYIMGMSIFGLQSGIQSSFLGLGQAKISLCIAILRKVVLLIPFAVILPHFFGVMGVYYAEPIADIISVVTACTLFLLNIRKILSLDTLAKVTHTDEK